MSREKEFYKAYTFIEGHPAFLGDVFAGVSSLSMSVQECCKNKWTQHGPMYVYRTDDRFEEFINCGHHEDLNKDMPEFDCIWVPYKDFYGYKWEYDHIEIWLEGGSHYYDVDATVPPWNWNRFHDIDLDSGGNTYEEAVINFAEKAKDKYGDYSSCWTEGNTVVPKWIVENNREFPAFNFDNGMSNLFKDGKLNRNPKSINVKQEEINALWWNIYDKDHEFYDGKLPDITKYLTKENYERNLKNE
jgi:hypothetical protein